MAASRAVSHGVIGAEEVRERLTVIHQHQSRPIQLLSRPLIQTLPSPPPTTRNPEVIAETGNENKRETAITANSCRDQAKFHMDPFNEASLALKPIKRCHFIF